MALNMAYEAFRQAEDRIMSSFVYNSVIDLFPKLEVPAGSHMVDLVIPLALGFSVGEVELLKRSLEAFRSITGEYQLPMIQKTVWLTQDEYDRLVAKGQLSAFMDRVGKEMAAAADRELVFNNSLTGNQKPFYGLNDLGADDTGTPSRPRPASSFTTLTKAGAWTTATYASSDRAALEGSIHQFAEFAGPLTLFYPAAAEIQLVKDVPGSTIGQRIKTTFEQSFRMVPMGNDENSLCISTKTAETSTNFRLIAANTAKFVFAAPRAPVVRIRDERASNDPKIFIDYEVYGGLIPIVLVTPDGKTTKATADMDTAGA
jgi:hypothetical protein